MKLGILFVFILILPGVLAVGISPGRVNIKFEPSEVVNSKVNLVNSGSSAEEFFVFSRGELGQAVFIGEPRILVPAGETVGVDYEVRLPGELSPGLHLADLVVVPASQIEIGGNSIGAVTGVVQQIYVSVPYPGTYLETELLVGEGLENEYMKFSVAAENQGTQPLSLTGVVRVYDQSENLIGEVLLQDRTIGPGNRWLFEGWWPANIRPGRYTAISYLGSEDESWENEKVFLVSEPQIIVKEVDVKNFRYGEIVPLEIIIESNWNDGLSDVHGEVVLYRNGERLKEIKTSSVDIQSFEGGKLTAYLDTSGLEPGNYEADVFIWVNGKPTVSKIEIELDETQMRVIGGSYSLSRRASWEIYALAGFGIAVLLAIIWFFFLRRRLHVKKKSRNYSDRSFKLWKHL